MFKLIGKIIIFSDYLKSILWTHIVKYNVNFDGKKIYVSGAISFNEPKSIYLGDNVVININTKFITHGGKIKLRNDVYLGSEVILYSKNSEIIISDRSYINHNVEFISEESNITVGRNVHIGMGTIFTTFNYSKFYPVSFDKMHGSAKEIVIEDDVWIGAHSIILSGVVIKKGAIVGAGSVVTKSVKEYGIVAGSPARQIGRRSILV